MRFEMPSPCPEEKRTVLPSPIGQSLLLRISLAAPYHLHETPVPATTSRQIRDTYLTIPSTP